MSTTGIRSTSRGIRSIRINAERRGDPDAARRDAVRGQGQHSSRSVAVCGAKECRTPRSSRCGVRQQKRGIPQGISLALKPGVTANYLAASVVSAAAASVVSAAASQQVVESHFSSVQPSHFASGAAASVAAASVASAAFLFELPQQPTMATAARTMTKEKIFFIGLITFI